MKEVYIVIVLLLVLNILCDDPARLVIDRFMDKSPKELFKVFHLVYKKDYPLDSQEAMIRYRIFKDNLKTIKETNAKNLSYKFGVNQFTDLTPEEYKSKYLTNFENLKSQIQRQGLLTYKSNKNKFIEVPKLRTKIDWKGLFNPAREQGLCGSCWAFASTGALEANWWKQNQSQKKISLAPQQLVDCSKANLGCGGGWLGPTFNYLIKEGVVEEDNYKYMENEGNCNIPYSARRIKIKDFKGCDDCSLEEWYGMLQQGPIAILIDASQFQFYYGGIMVFDTCIQTTHAIIATGWDSDAQGDLVTIRNSWGPSWGEGGYMRLRVNQSNKKSCFATQYGYLPILSGVDDCFNPNNNWYFKSWNLPQPFAGVVSFKVIGVDFSIGSFWSNDSNYNGYSINFTANSINLSNSQKVQVCSWEFKINSSIENKFKITFSMSRKSITVDVNDVEMICFENSWAALTNYVGFISPSSSVKICDVDISYSE